MEHLIYIGTWLRQRAQSLILFFLLRLWWVWINVAKQKALSSSSSFFFFSEFFLCDSVSKVGVAIIAHYGLEGLLYQCHKICTCLMFFAVLDCIAFLRKVITEYQSNETTF